MISHRERIGFTEEAENTEKAARRVSAAAGRRATAWWSPRFQQLAIVRKTRTALCTSVALVTSVLSLLCVLWFIVALCPRPGGLSAPRAPRAASIRRRTR